MDGPNGVNARIERLEADVRDLFGRVSANEKILAALPFVREDIQDIKDDCAATRTWVEDQMKARRAQESKETEFSTMQKVAVIGAVALVLTSLIGAVASLVAAGAFS